MPLGSSVHAAAAPFLMSPMVTIPATTARSPHCRSPDQNALLHLGPQKRCREPPRRGSKGLPHQRQRTSAIAAPRMTHMTQNDAPAMEAAVTRAYVRARVRGLK